jgi:hypothetical protein
MRLNENARRPSSSSLAWFKTAAGVLISHGRSKRVRLKLEPSPWSVGGGSSVSSYNLRPQMAAVRH